MRKIIIFILMIVLFSFSVYAVNPKNLCYDSGLYQTGKYNSDNWWFGTLLKVNSTYNLESVSIPLNNYGYQSSDFKLQIRQWNETDATTFYTNKTLYTKTIASNLIASHETNVFSWYNFSVTGVTLKKNMNYTIIFHQHQGDATHHLEFGTAGNVCSDSKEVSNTNNGTNFVCEVNSGTCPVDFMFKLYGSVPVCNWQSALCIEDCYTLLNDFYGSNNYNCSAFDLLDCADRVYNNNYACSNGLPKYTNSTNQSFMINNTFLYGNETYENGTSPSTFTNTENNKEFLPDGMFGFYSNYLAVFGVLGIIIVIALFGAMFTTNIIAISIVGILSALLVWALGLITMSIFIIILIVFILVLILGITIMKESAPI